MRLSDYDPDSHADPPTFYLIDIDTIKASGRIDECKGHDPEPVVEHPSGTTYAPEGTEAAEILREIGAEACGPGDPDRDEWEEKWRSIHGEVGL